MADETRAEEPRGRRSAYLAGARVTLATTALGAGVLWAVVGRPAMAQAGNIVVNGGFEEPVLDNNTFQLLATIPGWDVTPGSTGTRIEVQRNRAGTALEGSQLAELDSDGSVGIGQTVPTSTGEAYVLRFAFSPRPNTGALQNRLEIRWGATVLGTLEGGAGGSDTAWTCYAAKMPATAPQTVLEFRDAGLPSDSLGTYLDDVRVRVATIADVALTQVPLALPCATPDPPVTPVTTVPIGTSTTSSSTTTSTSTSTTSTTSTTVPRELPATGDDSSVTRLILVAVLIAASAGTWRVATRRT